MPKIRIEKTQEVWRPLKMHLPEGYTVTLYDHDLGIYLDPTSDTTSVFFFIDPGVYTLSEVGTRDGRIWWLFQGSWWGALKETWTNRRECGAISILEGNIIEIPEFVRKNYGKEMLTHMDRNRMSLVSFDPTKNAFVEEIIQQEPERGRAYPLNQVILGYLPTGAQVEGDQITLLEQ